MFECVKLETEERKKEESNEEHPRESHKVPQVCTDYMFYDYKQILITNRGTKKLCLLTVYSSFDNREKRRFGANSGASEFMYSSLVMLSQRTGSPIVSQRCIAA